VHARFDLLADGIDSGHAEFGTTNVDINQPLRNALSAVGRAQLLHLAVGDDELRVSMPDATYVEREVELPDRWVRGFAETPQLARASTLAAELRGPAVTRFLGSLPRAAKSPGPDLYLVPTGAGLSTRLRPWADSVFLAGSARLRAGARIARFATSMRVYRSEVGSSGWVFDLPGGRFTLLLTPAAYRGFSGEGSLLTFLARPEAQEVGQRVAAQLAWQPVISPKRIAEDLRLPICDVDAGLAWLAASGRVGFDLAEQTWFHRELPIDADSVIRRNPRLTSAQRIVDSRSVERAGDAWVVAGTKRDHYRVRGQNSGFVCECRWESDHGGSRGPCKHILAVMITEGGAGRRG
jgi:hypothetical protein